MRGQKPKEEREKNEEEKRKKKGKSSSVGFLVLGVIFSCSEGDGILKNKGGDQIRGGKLEELWKFSFVEGGAGVVVSFSCFISLNT